MLSFLCMIYVKWALLCSSGVCLPRGKTGLGLYAKQVHQILSALTFPMLRSQATIHDWWIILTLHPFPNSPMSTPKLLPSFPISPTHSFFPKINSSISWYAFSKSSFTMTISWTPSVLEYSNSFFACRSRFWMESSFSVPRPRRRDSRVSMEGGEMNMYRAEMGEAWICFTPWGERG